MARNEPKGYGASMWNIDGIQVRYGDTVQMANGGEWIRSCTIQSEHEAISAVCVVLAKRNAFRIVRNGETVLS